MLRLAEAAERVGGGVESEILIALAQRNLRDDEHAAQLVARVLEHDDLTNEQRVRVVEALATSLAHKLGRAEDARALLRAEIERADSDLVVAALDNLWVALFHADRWSGGAPVGASGGPRDGADEAATLELMRWFGTAQQDLLHGRFDAVVSIAPAMAAIAEQFVDTRPEGRLWVDVVRFYALMHLCRFTEAERRASTGLAETLDRSHGAARAWWLDLLGIMTLERGDAASAAELLDEAAAIRRTDDPGMLAGPLLGLAVAASWLGDVERAEAALDESRRCAVGVLTPMIEAPRAEAAVLAASGRLPTAQRVAVEYATAAIRDDKPLYAMWGWRDAARYGATLDAATALADLAPTFDGPLAVALRDSIDARARRDRAALITASSALDGIGMTLDAAEALASAATLGPGADVRYLSELRRQVGSVRTPLLTEVDGDARLSAREHEIAVLAAAGRRDAEIAADLVLSTRTVNAHLRSVYTKLGIRSRHDIAAALAAHREEPTSTPSVD
jgi:DNA-binding CsgD family transcriptional regulator